MATTNSTTASRLRRTFRYPSDSDSDTPLDLDEEHQEHLINSLQVADAYSTETYRLIFLVVPVLATCFFLFLLLTATSARGRIVALLGGSCCACTAYILHFLPLPEPRSDAGGGSGRGASDGSRWDRGKGKQALWSTGAGSGGPLEQFLLPLNAGLAGLLVMVAGAAFRRGGGAEKETWHATIPAIVLVLTVLVRRLLAPVDVEELKTARYELKGA